MYIFSTVHSGMRTGMLVSSMRLWCSVSYVFSTFIRWKGHSYSISGSVLELGVVHKEVPDRVVVTIRETKACVEVVIAVQEADYIRGLWQAVVCPRRARRKISAVVRPAEDGKE